MQKTVPARIYKAQRDLAAKLIRQIQRLDPTRHLTHADIHAKGCEAIHKELSPHNPKGQA